MNITIIGYGNMGSALARLLGRSGHHITLTGRDLDKAKEVASHSGGKVSPLHEAAKDVDIIIAATPFTSQIESLKSLGNLFGKIVIEISNPLKPDMSGLQIGLTTSAAEEVSRLFPDSKVVKAFNTTFAQVLQEGPVFKTGKAQVFYAGDDEAAKSKVKLLIESLGFEAMDAGPLANSRYLEPMGMLNIWFGYMAQKGTGIAPAWISRV